MMHYIYVIQNITTGMLYIGRSNNPAARKRGHFSELRRNIHGNPRLQASFNKHGEDAFEFKVVDYAEAHEIESKESEWFSSFNKEKNVLYNCHFETRGGPIIFGPMDEATKEKIAESIRAGTRKYIFDVLDEGYEKKEGLRSLAKRHKVGATTLISYKSEWEATRGAKYGHPQVSGSKSRLEKLFSDYRRIGPSVMRNLKKYGVSIKSVRRYCQEFGVQFSELRLDDWKKDAAHKAQLAVEYRIKTSCSAAEAVAKFNATKATFYKLWKQQTSSHI